MREVHVRGFNLPTAYHLALQGLYDHGEISEVPDYNQKQRECAMTVVVENPLAEPRISRLMLGGPHELQQYEMEVLDGILDFMIGADENTWEYTYHDRMVKYPVYENMYADVHAKDPLDQLQFVVAELRRNPFSRRAVIIIRDPSIDAFIANPACLQNIQFFIRNGKLDMMVLFRSNDLPEAFFYNAWALIRLQEKLAEILEVEVGTYTHRSNSMHCYEKDFELLEGYINGIETRAVEDLTYDYIDLFKDMMDEEIPSILEMVLDQKAKVEG